MKKLTGIKLALAAAIVTTLGAIPSLAASVELKVSHQWKQGTDARDRALRVFTEEVTKRVPDVKFRIYPALSLNIKALAQFDAMQAGNLDMSIYPLVYATGKAPEFSATILPGTVANLAEAKKLKGSAFHQKLQEIAHKHGVHVLTWWWTPGGFASRKSEIAGPDTIKGLSMRAADPIYEVMLKSAGSSIQSMPSTELYSAMQSGVLDALLTSAESLVSMRLYEQSKFATLGGDYTLFMLLQPLVISKKVWDGLTAEQKKAFEEAATASEKFFDGTQDESVKQAVEAYSKAGVKVRPLNKAEYDAWVALAKRTSWPEFEGKSADAKALMQALMTSLGR
jgi:TRAP-type C4-dicarboxylate transport system substrate-binding protein